MMGWEGTVAVSWLPSLPRRSSSMLGGAAHHSPALPSVTQQSLGTAASLQPGMRLGSYIRYKVSLCPVRPLAAPFSSLNSKGKRPCCSVGQQHRVVLVLVSSASRAEPLGMGSVRRTALPTAPCETP
ncbi:unnamed protein product [Lota lota]